MKLMKAVQVSSPGADFELVQKEIPVPGDNEILIKVEACGICHGDIVAKEGHYPGIKYPIVPGHEVVGLVDKTGKSITKWKAGQRVGVGWHGGHCNQCEECRRGDFGACEKALTTGIHLDGGYAEYMIARPEAVVSIPDELSSVDAAPIICAGRTTFGALINSGAKGGDLVAIHGLGGLGHFAVQYSVKLGYKTVVLSRGKDKEELAYKLGAHFYIDTDNGDAAKQLMQLGGARVILCTAPSGKAIAELIPGLGRNGQAIIVTGAADIMQINPLVLLGEQRSVKGFVSGNIKDALDFTVLTNIIPMVEVFPLEQAALAFEKMMSAKVRFRSVLKMD
jgi:D-arabinose 1-dehydrogenase-like Zn-dependent alcohol dehydrogenase